MKPLTTHQDCCSLSKLLFGVLGLLLVALLNTHSSARLAAQAPPVEPRDLAGTLLTLDDFPSGWQAEPITIDLPRSTDPEVCDLFTLLSPTVQERAGIVFERRMQLVFHRVFQYPAGDASLVMDALDTAFSRCDHWTLEIDGLGYQPLRLPSPSLADRSLAVRFRRESSESEVPRAMSFTSGSEADLVRFIPL